MDFLTISWTFNKGQTIASIITHIPSTNTKNIDEKYASRISYNETTCEVQLRSLMKEDGGEYILNVVTSKGTQQTGQINLEVLGKY